MTQDQRTRRGYLLLADISGYTAFLAGTELEHANATCSCFGARDGRYEPRRCPLTWPGLATHPGVGFTGAGGLLSGLEVLAVTRRR